MQCLTIQAGKGLPVSGNRAVGHEPAVCGSIDCVTISLQPLMEWVAEDVEGLKFPHAIPLITFS